MKSTSLCKLGPIASDRGAYTAPDIFCWESVHVEAGHDAEVSGSSFERREEIGVRLSVGINDRAIGKDNLKVGYVIRRPAIATSVVRVPASSQEAADTNVAISAPRDADAIFQKVFVDITPPRSGLD